MPSFCSVINCGNRSNRDRKSFFRIPGIPKKASEARTKLFAERRNRWLAALRRANLTPEKIQYLRICEDHFVSGKPSALRDVDHPDWVPSKNMGYRKNLDGSVLEQFKRKKRKFDAVGDLSSSDEGAGDDDAIVRKQEYEELSIIKQMEDDIRKEIFDEMQRTVQNSEIPNEDDELLNVKLELNQAYTEINILTKTKDMISKELSTAFKKQKSLINAISEKDDELSRLKFELEEAKADVNILSSETYSLAEKFEMALSKKETLENMLSEKPELEKNLKQAFAEIDALRKERDELEEEHTAANVTKAILQDPKKLRYYTGLKSVEDFISLLMLLEKFKSGANSVPIETKFLIVLMRLRGHFKYEDLGYRFDVTGSKISTICDKIIPFLEKKLEDLINNPTYDISQNLPDGSNITVYENLLHKIQKYSKIENKKFWSEIG